MGFEGVDDLFGDLPNYPGKTPPKNRDKKPAQYDGPLAALKPTVYIINGEAQDFYTIGQLAQALGRKPGTIRMWEDRGRIPPATYRTAEPAGEQIPGKRLRGRRLYSRRQVELIIQAVELFIGDNPKNNSARWNEFKQYIKQHWIK